MTNTMSGGLSLAPFRGLRYTPLAGALGAQICPPYDVISPAQREELVTASASNAVRLILPSGPEPYADADRLLTDWTARGILAVDAEPALYVYEMSTPDGSLTRGLVGAVQLRDPAAGVILPHENTMAGPVSDRLALMTATRANLEPIYLAYDGGGAASELVASVNPAEVLSHAVTPDQITHRLWAVTDPVVLAEVARDLDSRRALIADGHHRYATYRQLQASHGGTPGPWDRGLALLVDSSAYGPQVHPIHRVVFLGWDEVLKRSGRGAHVTGVMPVAEALTLLESSDGFAIVLAYDAEHAVLLSAVDSGLIPEPGGGAAEQALAALDVNILHRVVVERLWGLADTEATVAYAHDVSEALQAADFSERTAMLLRATPVTAVAAVAAAGGRMPRKSTLFTPKPASGMVMRRFADQ